MSATNILYKITTTNPCLSSTIPVRKMTYGAASKWVRMQAPGTQMYYNIEIHTEK
jgi:hypothetical protein